MPEVTVAHPVDLIPVDELPEYSLDTIADPASIPYPDRVGIVNDLAIGCQWP
jgi:hypothetical protein